LTTSTRLLVFAIGNDLRGDDALGPVLGERIAALQLEGVRVLPEYQLQVEHVLDMVEAGAVLFVDAARALGQVFRYEAVVPDCGTPVLSHALSPSALLGVYERINRCPPPPAYVLALDGLNFELDAPLSAGAQHALDQAWAWTKPKLLAGLPLTRWEAAS